MEDLKILQKTHDMILYGNICLKQFPRYEKHVMAANIRESMYRMLSLIIQANKKYYKKTTLQDIDVELDILRTFIRLAVDKELKYLSVSKYENWSKMLNEIGRMLGGWIKSAKK
ncbi:conserved hypothetical protein [Desulfofarcimen acetoxidans DSM 771]|uniref:bAvd-like domain-containing protein n=1 Tax=Desulfofarcimen acetoxidans (strain ATCC 49208 / DSM 771 / KCTC 5769 / VKM B-1644 / 5575) TaxID=485916 RepID=C8VZH9_DESAS|nr:diversity-generating retroelement protein Avd [Desulfofarcimen acetoxidans]ACV64924.1 conserved hypothetical protein [Desulfofarcimen acetoxidans DSM 771]